MTVPASASAPSPGPAGHFDARALLEPVNSAEVDAFARARRANGPSSAGRIVAWVFAGIALLCVVPVIGLMIMGLGYAIGRGAGVAVG
ncbi:hypothetical protein J7E68_07430, partial [Microbacterium sp. ISL-103]